MKNIIILFVSLLIITSCNKDDFKTKEDETSQEEPISDEEFASENFGNPLIANFVGLVVDESGKQLKDVQIIIENETVLTDHNGVFVLNSVSVKDKFAFVKASKQGYIKGSRSLVPTTKGSNDIQITLLKKNVLGTINSGESSEVIMQNGSKVSFDGDFINAFGNPYSGQVEVSMHYLAPNGQNTFSQMPGMLFGQREDGAASTMETYGMLAINLFSPSGEVLNISKASIAELTFPVSVTTPNAPNEIALWFFDDTVGYWREQGVAYKQGNMFKAEVSHFTWWNCDLPISRTIKGCMTFVNKNALADYYLEVIRVDSDQKIFEGFTNSEGEECGLFPKNERLQIKVYSDCQENLLYEKIVGSFNDDINIEIEVPLTTDIIETQLQAVLQDCTGNSITNGYVWLFDDNLKGTVIDLIDGQLNYNLSSCAGKNYSLIAYNNEVKISSEVIDVNLTLNTTDLGVISVCGNEIGGVFEGNLNFSTQEELDLFGLLGYSEIQGNLFLADLSSGQNFQNDINDLTPLNSIKIITGLLGVFGTKLTDLSGLEALTQVDGNLFISKNYSLSNMSRLGVNLQVGGNLDITENTSLIDLSGLDNIISVGENILIRDNTSLTSLSGLTALSVFNGGVTISNNPLLESLMPLKDFLPSEMGGLRIVDNSSLLNLTGLENITSLNGDLYIENNDALINLSGVDNITSVTYLYIVDNQSLQSLAGLEKLQTVTEGVVGIGVLVFVSGQTAPRPNPNLSNFCALNNLFNNGTYDTIYIENNAYNPTVQNIKDGNCEQ